MWEKSSPVFGDGFLKRVVCCIASFALAIMMVPAVAMPTLAWGAESDCLTFTSDESFTITTGRYQVFSNLEFSTNGSDWTVLPEDDGKTQYAMVADAASADGKYRLYLRGFDNAQITGQTTEMDNVKWLLTSTSGVSCDGNIMTLLDYRNPDNAIMGEYAFANLFKDWGNLDSVSSGFLPATTLSKGCYRGLFSGTSLSTAPTLPATNLAGECYMEMFKDCGNLASAPELPATVMQPSCYYSMFYGCTKLKQPPALNAMTLSESCYFQMFTGCSVLEAAPNLPAEQLANYCYFKMFQECASLTTPAVMAFKSTADYCFDTMYCECTSLTTPAAMNGVTSLAKGSCASMYQGCTSLTQTADLSTVATLGQSACKGMYKGCTKIASPSAFGAVTEIPVYACYEMYSGCTSLSVPMDLGSVITLGKNACYSMYFGCTSLTRSSDLTAATTFGDSACYSMYEGCTSLARPGYIGSVTTLPRESCRRMYYGCTGVKIYKDSTIDHPTPWGAINATAGGLNWSYDMLYSTKGDFKKNPEVGVAYYIAAKTVTVDPGIQNGTVATSVYYADAGDEVVITPTPASGCAVSSVTVNGTAIEPTAGVYRFTMPDENVVVSASFYKEHKHCVCGAEHENVGDHTTESKVAFKEWASTDSLPTTAGNYYLTNDVAISGTWNPASGTTLCLNGHVVKHTGDSRFINISNTLTITDCSSTIHHFDQNAATGLWVLNDSSTSSSHTVTGGVITGGTHYLGAITVNKSGVLNLYGGNVVGNTTVYGSVDVYGVLNMYGGAIKGNYSTNTSGVYVVKDNGYFNMFGGSIAANNCSHGNKKGVFQELSGRITLGGKAVIDELFLEIVPVALSSTYPLQEGASITVIAYPALYGNAIDVTSAFATEEAATAAAAYFHNDQGYDIVVENSKVRLSDVKHTWAYAASGAKITATCNKASHASVESPRTTESVELIAPVLLTYDGNAKACAQKNTYTSASPGVFQSLLGAKLGSIKYYEKGEGSVWTELSAAPVAAGSYKAGVTLDLSPDESPTAFVEFTIAKADVVLSDISATAITYGQTLANSTASGTAMFGETAVEGTWAWKTDKSTAPSVSDSDTTEYEVTFTPTSANFSAKDGKVKLTVNKAKVDVPSAITGLVYNASEQVGVASPSEAKYALKDNRATNAGSYKATAILIDKDNYEWNLGTPTSDDQTIEWSIAKADSSWTTEPAAKADLVYSGSAQGLVSGGTAAGAIAYYGLGSEEPWVWSDSVPTATDAGAYYVWYKAMGDANHRGIAAAKVTVTIAPKDLTNVATIDAIADQVYTGSAIAPTLIVKYGETTLALGTDYTVEYSDNVNAGTAKATVTFKGNYSGTASAQFNIKYLVASFDANGHGTAPDQQNLALNAKIAKPADPSADGYTFGGWYKEATCTNTWDFDSETVTSDITLYAKWTANTYTIEYNSNGGTGIMADQPMVYDVAANLTRNGFNRTGHTFVGWNTDPSGRGASYANGAEVKNLAAEQGATVTLYARWGINSYKVTFDANGHGVAPASQMVIYGCKVAEPEAPVAMGYTFGGWYRNKECTVPYNFNTSVATGITLYAKWTINEYAVVFDTNGHGSAPAVQAVTHEGKAVEPDAPVATGYAFGGWFADKACIVAYDFDTPVTADTTLYAKWIANSYIVTFDANGHGATPDKLAADYGTKIQEPASLKAEGYSFGGWFKEKTCVKAWDFETDIVEDDMILYAKWTAVDTKITRTLAINASYKVTQTKSSIDIKWGKVNGAKGYKVYAAYCGSKMKLVKTIKSGTIKSFKLTKLNGKKLNLRKNFKVKIVAYGAGGKTLAKTIAGHVVGKKNAKRTNAKAIKLSKKKCALSVGKTFKIKAKTILYDPKKKQLGDAHAKEFRYASSDKGVATVSKSGVVTARGAGTCVVYVYSRNGLAKKLSVTVG